MRQKCMGLVGQPGVDKATGEHSHVPSKEKTSTYRTVGELGPEPLRGVQAAAVLFKPPTALKALMAMDQSRRYIAVRLVLQRLLAGFALFSPFNTFTNITKPFSIRENAGITHKKLRIAAL